MTLNPVKRHSFHFRPKKDATTTKKKRNHPNPFERKVLGHLFISKHYQVGVRHICIYIYHVWTIFETELTLSYPIKWGPALSFSKRPMLCCEGWYNERTTEFKIRFDRQTACLLLIWFIKIKCFCIFYLMMSVSAGSKSTRIYLMLLWSLYLSAIWMLCR